MPNTAVILARLDPLSLEPVSRPVHLGEYHDAWSLSPDRSRLALGISAPGRSGRVGILIVDLEGMKVVREIETGGAAEALAWLTPRLLVAALVRDGTVIVDPLTGNVLRRWPRLSEPQASAHAQGGFVLLFRGPPRSTAKGEGVAAPRLAVIDAPGRLRSVVLERIQLGVRYRASEAFADSAGLAVDPGREHAYVFAADAPVADIDLRTMRVTYHRLEPLFLGPGEAVGAEAQRKSAVWARNRRAIWLTGGHVIVSGRDYVAAAGEDFASIPAGAILVDTARWSSCLLDDDASGAALVAERLLAYGPGSPVSRELQGVGLRAYTVEGRETFHLLEREQVWDVHGARDFAYVRTPSAVHVLDVDSGKVVNEIVPPPDLVDLGTGSS